MSQTNFFKKVLSATLSSLTPKPSSARFLHTFFRVTIIIFLEDMESDHIKFMMQEFSSLIIELGHFIQEERMGEGPKDY